MMMMILIKNIRIPIKISMSGVLGYDDLKHINKGENIR
jgi:hypothetical protein